MTYIIAEIGTNHDGDPSTFIELVQAACATNVDAIKLQHFTADKLVSKDMPAFTGTHKTQWERVKSLELPLASFEEAREITDKHHIDLIVTPFDISVVGYIGLLADKIKIASGDITYIPLLKACADVGKPIILSTGMASSAEICVAVDTAKPYAILHCVSNYPTPYSEANLSRITELGELFDLKGRRQLKHFLKIGYSDHTIGITACIAAATLGAEIIEKHFTLDNSLPHGDHPHSSDYNEMLALVRAIREVEWMKIPSDGADLDNRQWLRRGEAGVRG